MNKKRSYDTAFRSLIVVEYAEQNTGTRKKYGVDEQCIHDWKQQKTSWLAYLAKCSVSGRM